MGSPLIHIDTAVGSKDLEPQLRALGLPVNLHHLEYGDLAFVGRGPGGRPLDIGIELKRIGDLTSSLRTGRLPYDQLPGFLRAYDYGWILVEGRWTHDAKGHVVQPLQHRNVRPLHMGADELEKRMLTLELVPDRTKRRPYIRHTNTRRDTLRFICALYRWWTDQDQDQHQSRVGIYVAPAFHEVSLFRQIVSRLPGVGIKRSLELERRIPPKTAQDAVARIRDLCAAYNNGQRSDDV